MTNDIWISPGDRWRTAAAEIGVGDFAVGFNNLLQAVLAKKFTSFKLPENHVFAGFFRFF